MATEIIGGMATSTLLSLLVVPCMYTYFDDLQVLLRRLVAWRPGQWPPARTPTDTPTPTPTPTPEPSGVPG